jgi:hypothetical protein
MQAETEEEVPIVDVDSDVDSDVEEASTALQLTDTPELCDSQRFSLRGTARVMRLPGARIDNL